MNLWQRSGLLIIVRLIRYGLYKGDEGLNDNFKSISENLSIIMQGPLHVGNIVQIANHSQHWRDLFPAAEIILSISTNEVMERIPQHERTGEERYKISHWHEPNVIASNAVNVIDYNCDNVVLAEPTIPLPPIKPTDGPNNSSFMINAAKAGLNAASRKYVLRIRSDVIFLNKNFLSLYLENVDRPRRFRSILKQRVMICNLFTVNPFCIERLPYHYSDWFNFGLLSDVRNIWDVPLMSYSDTLYYKVNPHKRGSNFREVNFNTRIGVEQHIYTSFLKNNNHNYTLDFHNDTRGTIDSLKVLENEFIIADASYIKVLTQDRSDYLTFDWVDYICIHYNQWKKLHTTSPADYRNIFLDKIEKSNEILQKNSGTADKIEREIEEFSGEVEYHGNNKTKDLTIPGRVILPIYKLILVPKMKRKFEKDKIAFFEDSKNKIAKKVYNISYK